jgi:hypothetical protein
MLLDNKLTYVSTLDISEFYMFLKQIEFGEVVDEEIIQSLKDNYEYFKSAGIGKNLDGNFEEHLINIKKTLVDELKRRKSN